MGIGTYYSLWKLMYWLSILHFEDANCQINGTQLKDHEIKNQLIQVSDHTVVAFPALLEFYYLVRKFISETIEETANGEVLNILRLGFDFRLCYPFFDSAELEFFGRLSEGLDDESLKSTLNRALESEGELYKIGFLPPLNAIRKFSAAYKSRGLPL